MSLAPPTRREIVLVVVLFTALLFLSKVHFDSRSRLISLSSPSTDFTNTIPAQNATARNYESRLSWGTAHVPETKIVAHVPGKSSPIPFLPLLT